MLVLLSAIVIGGRIYTAKEQERQGYLMKIFANSADHVEGIPWKQTVTIKLYKDKITFNDLATIRLENIEKVSHVHTFIRKTSPNPRHIYMTKPYFHDITIDYISADGGKSYVRLEKMGKLTGHFNELRNTILKLKGIEEKPFQPPTAPYEL